MVNLARSAALCCTITTLICGLTSLLQRLAFVYRIYSINREAYRNNRQRCLEMLTFSSFSSIRSCRVTKRKAKRRFWIRPGRTSIWWDKLLTKTVGFNGRIGSVSSLRNRVVFDAVSMSWNGFDLKPRPCKRSLKLLEYTCHAHFYCSYLTSCSGTDFYLHSCYHTLFYGQLRVRARWIKSCAVIGYPSGHDQWSYLARSGLSAASRRKNFPGSNVINPLLIKLVRSRWLDIGLVFFFACLWTSTTSRSINQRLASNRPTEALASVISFTFVVYSHYKHS